MQALTTLKRDRGEVSGGKNGQAGIEDCTVTEQSPVPSLCVDGKMIDFIWFMQSL